MKKLNSAALAVLTLLIFASIVCYIFMGLFAVASRIMFFASLIGVIIYASINYRALQAFFRKSGTLTGMNKSFQFIAVSGILVFAYLFSGMIPWKIDLTASRLYSLSGKHPTF